MSSQSTFIAAGARRRLTRAAAPRRGSALLAAAHRAAALLAATVLTAATAAAQDAPPPRVVAGQDGIAIESGDGDFRLQIGLLVHADGRFALDDEAGQIVDTFAARRVRPYFRGRVARRFEFYVNPDVAGSTLVLQDAYLDTVFTPAFRIRAGKAKTPFGMERLHSAANLLFMERALPTALVPNRDVGIQALGDIGGGVVSYLAGVMNGVADGASADVDTTDSKDVSARLVVRPFNRRAAGSVARGLGLAVSASAGRATGAAALPSFRTATLLQPFFSYASGAGGSLADGTRTRYSPQAWYFFRGVGGWVEYVHTETPVRHGAAVEDVAHDAWQVAASYVLTGEAATDAGGGVRPRADFDFGRGDWGALQIAARYHALEVGDDVFPLGFAAAGASSTASAWTVGANWYLTANVRHAFNFERTVFDAGAGDARPAENALAFRTQLNF